MPHLTTAQKSRLHKLFASFTKKEATVRDLETVAKNEDAIKQKAERGFLAKFADEVSTLISLVKTVAKREYTGLSKTNLAAIVFTLIYVFSPIDIIPDAIPVAGLLDDAGMVGLCLKLVHGAVAAYKNWQAETGGVSHLIEEKVLSTVQATIEPHVRSYCKQAIVWSFVGLAFSAAGIAILFFKPFPTSVNNDIAFVIFDVTLVCTLVRITISLVRYRTDGARVWQNWKAARGEVHRVQKAIGRSVFVSVPQQSVVRFALQKIGGVTVTDDHITLDDIFVLKNKLPLGDINEHFPDLFSLAKHYARQFRTIFALTAGTLLLNGFLVGFLLKQFAITATSDATFWQRLCLPFADVWRYLTSR